MVINDILKIVNENNMAMTVKDREFISSVSEYVIEKNRITSSQSRYLISILNRCFDELVNYGIDKLELRNLLDEPKYSIEVIDRSGPSVEYVGNGIFVFKNFFKIHENENFMKVKDYYYGDRSSVSYDGINRQWIIKVTKDNYMHVMECIKSNNAKYTDDVLYYLYLIDENNGSEYEILTDETMIHIDLKDDIFMNDMMKDIF